MKTKRLMIVNIPAMQTANYVANILFLLSFALLLLKGASPQSSHGSAFGFLANVLVGALAVGMTSWIISVIVFAIYNKLSRRSGGIEVLVAMED